MLQPYFFAKVLATRCCTQWDDQMICKPILNETNKPQAWIPQKTSGIGPCRRCLSRPIFQTKISLKNFRWHDDRKAGANKRRISLRYTEEFFLPRVRLVFWRELHGCSTCGFPKVCFSGFFKVVGPALIFVCVCVCIMCLAYVWVYKWPKCKQPSSVLRL